MIHLFLALPGSAYHGLSYSFWFTQTGSRVAELHVLKLYSFALSFRNLVSVRKFASNSTVTPCCGVWVHLHIFLPLLQTVMTSYLPSTGGRDFPDVPALGESICFNGGKLFSLAVGLGLEEDTEIWMTESTRLASYKNEEMKE